LFSASLLLGSAAGLAMVVAVAVVMRKKIINRASNVKDSMALIPDQP
jgi:hypothetical protein